MEISLAIISHLVVLLIVLGHFVEGFTAFNLIQFFRGKETPLEKMVLSKNQRHMNQLKND